MLTQWIWFSQCTGVNAITKLELLETFSGAEGIYDASLSDLQSATGLPADKLESLLEKDLTQAREIEQTCRKKQIGIITIMDPDYPNRLKNIPDPPMVLYYKGTFPDFDNLPVIGIVGTRHPSVYGARAARRIGYEAASCGGIIVSGAAMGIDKEAMTGALSAGQSAVGVLGCGVDVVYPRSNRELYAQTEQFGCLISEYAPGTEPLSWNFPKRNRIISGLSRGIVVIEAPEKSGALITARMANDQGRDVFVLPGNVDMAGFVGSNRLLRSGAIAISTGWDVMAEYEDQYPDIISQDQTEPPVIAEEPEQIRKSEEKQLESASNPRSKATESKKMIDKAKPSPYIDVNEILTGLSAEERTIVAAIAQKEQSLDDVILAAGMPAGRVLAILTMLEIRGIIVRHPGRRVSLKEKA